MPAYDYLALDAAGREQRGRLVAETESDARAALARRKLLPVRLAPGTGNSERAPSFLSSLGGRRRLKPRQLTLLTRQLATLVRVSPLEEALRTMVLQADHPAVEGVLSAVHGGVVEGHRLSDAMGRETPSFPPLYRAMISAGERSGALPDILERLADLMERQAEVRGKLVTALAYPIMLALVAVGVVFALMAFVVPRVVEQFSSLDREMPLLTRIVIGLSDIVARYGLVLLALLVVAGLLFARAMRNPELHFRVDRALLRLPGIGRLLRDLHAARLARTLSTMIAGGLPLIEGLGITARTVRNQVLARATLGMAEAIREGGSLSASLRRAAVFPAILVAMTAAGEASGRLDIMLARAADYLEREFDTFTATALSLLEPAIIIVMGGVVAVIILAILMPILQLSTLPAA
jgi:general secretion pathway protein F